MRFPIFVFDGGDVTLFPSKQEASSYLEPIDVKNGVYACYDANGDVVRLEVIATEKQSKLSGNYVHEHVGVAGTDINRRDELRERLLAYLRAVDSDNVKSDTTLPDLVRIVEAHCFGAER